jgi:hypothetical protein
MALARGDSPPTPKALRERQDRIDARPSLEHLLATNQFFVDLLVHGVRPSAPRPPRTTAPSAPDRFARRPFAAWSALHRPAAFRPLLPSAPAHQHVLVRSAHLSGGGSPCPTPMLVSD